MHEISSKYPAQYSSLLSEETWAYIARVEASYPHDATTHSAEKQREYNNALHKEFTAPYPESVSADDITISHGGISIPCRYYQPTEGELIPTTTILYLHGGGFVVGNLESHDDICAEICERTQLHVVAADYRLSPEYRHPAAYTDALEVYRWLKARPKNKVILCGDSAGATLAAAVAHQGRQDELDALGQVLIYPALGGNRGAGSYITHAEAPMLTTADIEYYEKIRLPGRQDKDGDEGIEEIMASVAFAPLNETDYSNLPPTIAFGASCDPLLDDAQIYCDHINEAGGQAHFVEEKGLVHSYLYARHAIKQAGESFDRIIDSLIALSEENFPPAFAEAAREAVEVD